MLDKIDFKSELFCSYFLTETHFLSQNEFLMSQGGNNQSSNPDSDLEVLG